jgi:hypothetical protein
MTWLGGHARLNEPRDIKTGNPPGKSFGFTSGSTTGLSRWDDLMTAKTLESERIEIYRHVLTPSFPSFRSTPMPA